MDSVVKKSFVTTCSECRHCNCDHDLYLANKLFYESSNACRLKNDQYIFIAVMMTHNYRCLSYSIIV